MAQDFKAAFNLGNDDKRITSIDADGVALAAIQGLNQKLNERESELAELRNENADLESRLAELESAFADLRSKAAGR
jgi:phage shock protein A